jgi:hypothetical protein
MLPLGSRLVLKHAFRLLVALGLRDRSCPVTGACKVPQHTTLLQYHNGPCLVMAGKHCPRLAGLPQETHNRSAQGLFITKKYGVILVSTRNSVSNIMASDLAHTMPWYRCCRYLNAGEAQPTRQARTNNVLGQPRKQLRRQNRSSSFGPGSYMIFLAHSSPRRPE